LSRTSRESPIALASADVAAFGQACTRIANEAADAGGFVPVRNLLERFHAQIVVRPLLVEGMLATQPGVQSEWLVLVDSELYQVTKDDFDQENSSRPLSPRLRFTVAHELVHSLAFRTSEFGIRLSTSINNEAPRASVVDAIEGITDSLTPLLLLSESALADFFKSSVVRTSAPDFAELRARTGVSRRTLLGRLRSLSQADANRLSRYSLEDIAICIGEWRERQAVIRASPVFARFARNVFPEFLLRLTNQDRMPASLAFHDASFAPSGGIRNNVETVMLAGTPGAPDAEKMHVHCSYEEADRDSGSEFFVVVRRVPIAQPVTK
jgi:hypothetical protein